MDEGAGGGEGRRRTAEDDMAQSSPHPATPPGSAGDRVPPGGSSRAEPGPSHTFATPARSSNATGGARGATLPRWTPCLMGRGGAVTVLWVHDCGT